MTNTQEEYGIREFQRKIDATYGERDSERGVEGTFVWFVEEVGELAKEIRKMNRDPQRLKEEFGDVFAWLSSLASLLGIEMVEAARIYADGCPKCRETPCNC
ncbi:MAG: nucleotide pyrophosphohydrolase [Candidatus Poribacteria bacterium]|nr:nucleotide pyrophosphohydrolase [Candidatus Poribacteria bacterium]